MERVAFTLHFLEEQTLQRHRAINPKLTEQQITTLRKLFRDLMKARYGQREFDCPQGTLSNIEMILFEMSSMKDFSSLFIQEKRFFLERQSRKTFKDSSIITNLPLLRILQIHPVHNLPFITNTLAPTFGLISKAQETDLYANLPSWYTRLLFVENMAKTYTSTAFIHGLSQGLADRVMGLVTLNIPTFTDLQDSNGGIRDNENLIKARRRYEDYCDSVFASLSHLKLTRYFQQSSSPKSSDILFILFDMKMIDDDTASVMVPQLNRFLFILRYAVLDKMVELDLMRCPDHRIFKVPLKCFHSAQWIYPFNTNFSTFSG